MGDACSKQAGTGDTPTGDFDLNRHAFRDLYALGRGGFGKVWRVEAKKSKEQFAMKEMAKARVISKKSVPSVMNELYLLTILSSKFIVNVHFAFQDTKTLYLVMDLLLGGDLRYHLARKRKFSEDATRFFVACLL
jgi:serine/threonine protein kinase